MKKRKLIIVMASILVVMAVVLSSHIEGRKEESATVTDASSTDGISMGGTFTEEAVTTENEQEVIIPYSDELSSGQSEDGENFTSESGKNSDDDTTKTETNGQNESNHASEDPLTTTEQSGSQHETTEASTETPNTDKYELPVIPAEDNKNH